LMRRHDDAFDALKSILKEKPTDLNAGYQWTSAAAKAKLYLLSRLKAEDAEEIFVVPLEHPEQARKLLGIETSFVVLPDAHKVLASLEKSVRTH
jgi:hypothetical protein